MLGNKLDAFIDTIKSKFCNLHMIVHADLPLDETKLEIVISRVTTKIAQGRSKPFIDDVGVKPASRSFYRKNGNGCGSEEDDGDGEFEEVLPGVRRYVMEAIISLDQTLADIERSGGTISGEKSEFLMDADLSTLRAEGDEEVEKSMRRLLRMTCLRTFAELSVI